LKSFSLVLECKGKANPTIGPRHGSIVPVVQPQATMPLKYESRIGCDSDRGIHAQAVPSIVLTRPLVFAESLDLCENLLPLALRGSLRAARVLFWLSIAGNGDACQEQHDANLCVYFHNCAVQ
jgi:hypothetical protein